VVTDYGILFINSERPNIFYIWSLVKTQWLMKLEGKQKPMASLQCFRFDPIVILLNNKYFIWDLC
jgi:hypothetical protein